MTEHDDPTNEDPTNVDPTSQRPADDEAAWFRAHVDPVVCGEVPDAWDEIQSRARGRQPILIPLPPAEARAWPGRRLVAVAALLLVVVGMVGIGLKLVGSDDADDQRLASDEDDGATGFYIPGALPEGWKVTSFFIGETDSGFGTSDVIACPCSFTEFEGNGSERYTTVTSAGGPEQLGSWMGTRRHPERGFIDRNRMPLEDRAGWYQGESESGITEPAMVVWHTATGSRAVASASLDRSALEAVADTWTTNGPPVLDGYEVVDTWDVDHPILARHSVSWTIENAGTGAVAHVNLQPKMFGENLVAAPTFALPDNGRPAATLPNTSGLIASWPGHAELRISSWGDLIDDGPDYTASADPATMKAILGSFRLVDATTWRNHLTPLYLDMNRFTEEMDRVIADMDTVRTNRISDWLEGPEPGADLPKRKVQVVENDPDDPSAAITVESNVDFVSVAKGEPFTIELSMTNRTGTTVEVSGCPFGGVTWSLIDEHGLVADAGGVAVDCVSDSDPWPDGEQRTQTFAFPGWGPMPDEGPISAVIQFGDSNSQGVTVVVPGQVGD